MAKIPLAQKKGGAFFALSYLYSASPLRKKTVSEQNARPGKRRAIHVGEIIPPRSYEQI